MEYTVREKRAHTGARMPERDNDANQHIIIW
jgi:hypothetical protein